MHSGARGREREEPLEIEIAGDSMRPLIPPGARILVRPCSPEELSPGDIALFRDPGGLQAHRVTESTTGPEGLTLTEMGDAKRAVRRRTGPEVIGRVVAIRLRHGTVQIESGIGGRLAAALGPGWRVRRWGRLPRRVGIVLTERMLEIGSALSTFLHGEHSNPPPAGRR